MNKIAEDKLYNKAITKWGLVSQSNMLIEEMAELTQALLHDRRSHKSITEENLIEEIVDVGIMISQFITLFPKDVIENIKQKKLKRLEKLLEDSEVLYPPTVGNTYCPINEPKNSIPPDERDQNV